MSNANDPAPPRSVRRPRKHLHDMTDEERLEALKEWAEEKKFIYPGESGSLAFNNVSSLAFGGPLRTVVSQSQAQDRYGGQYEAPVGPPSYHFSISDLSAAEDKSNRFQRWLRKRKVQRDAKRHGSLPGYAP